MAIGTEGGAIRIHRIDREGSSEHVGDVETSIAHAGVVNRLAWRPASGDRNGLELASCSDDRSVRIFEVEL